MTLGIAETEPGTGKEGLRLEKTSEKATFLPKIGYSDDSEEGLAQETTKILK